jgi:choline dehydrogenase-like flavoprotein
MHIDFSETNESAFKADICIIGAGAAGFAGAMSLLHSGLKVIVLEGGLNSFDPKAADLHQGKVTGQPHTGIHDARERIVGGTTTKWGGQALPFMVEDFQKREYVNCSGWPISLDDLMPFYKKAETVLGTDPSVDFDYNPWEERKIAEPGFKVDSLRLFVTKWCKVPNFAIQHGAAIDASNNITLLRNANVVELVPNKENNAVEALKIRSLDGKTGFVHAKYVIAAGGAIETVRLFLVSKKFGAKGLGNENGLVGRYFQDHVSATVGQIIPANRKAFNNLFDPFYKRKFKYFPRLRVSPKFSKKQQALHSSAQVAFSEQEDSVLGAAKQVFSKLKKKERPDFGDIKSLVNPQKLAELAGVMSRWKIGNRGSSPTSGPVWLEIHSEQEPTAESNITLDESFDAFGMPRVRLNWSISELTIKTIRSTAQLVQKEFSEAGIAEVKLEPWVKNNSNPHCWLSDVYHQAGGLRMANTADEGVVDSSCQVFGVQNLYVASSAVFPTSSFSNPTMTTIALSIRIADEVSKKLSEMK